MGYIGLLYYPAGCDISIAYFPSMRTFLWHVVYFVKPSFSLSDWLNLTFILLMWNIWWAANNASTTNV
jgi:hypothetical protein